MEIQKPRSGQKTLKRNKVRALSTSDFRTYYKPSEIKTEWYWPKDRQIDQWNRRKSPEIDPHLYSQLIFFFLSAKTIQQGKSFLNGTRTTGYPSEKDTMSDSIL